jgi:hypothetical protein
MSYTQQDRAKVGSKLSTKDRQRVGDMARLLRDIATRSQYVCDEDVDFEADILLDLADQLDQIAMPIQVPK